ncbi:Cas4 family exonuclease [Microbacterium phage SallyK]|nr:Cas4 family exonuclease [Microbacterium phage SallyK]
MAAENIGKAEIIRDVELEQRLLEAVIADRNAQPRSQQLQIGPSEVGGCRELLRAGLFEPPAEAEPETNWAAAAHVGQVMGADLERIFGERVNALLQQRYSTLFGMFGISISGGADLTFLDGDQISDLKSIDDMGSTLYDLNRDAQAIETLLSIYREGLLFAKNIETADGGYELTGVILDKVAKLSNYIQIAIYVMGAMQAGIISEHGTGRLVFYDRSGNYQGFVAAVIPTEWVWMFYTIGQMRIGQVVQAQTAYDATGGNPAVIATLRDKAPSFCFSPKVMCPRRMHCWAGSEWTADNQITDPEQVAAMNRYDTARDLAKIADGMKRAAKTALDGVSGVAPDGKMLTWTRSGAINLVQTTVAEPKTQEVLDQFLPPVNLQAEIEAERQRAAVAPVVTNAPQVDTSAAPVDTESPELHTGYDDSLDESERQVIHEQTVSTPTLTREQRYKALAKTGAPEVRRMANRITGIELKGLRKDDAIDAILNHEYPKTPSEADVPVEATASEGDYPGDAGDDLAPQNGPEFYEAPADASDCPECGGDNWHHSVECFTGQARQVAVQEAHEAGLRQSAAAWEADPHRISPLEGVDAERAAQYHAEQKAHRDQLIQDVAATMTEQQVAELNRFAAEMPRDEDARHPRPEEQEQPVNPGLGRVVFEPAFSEQQVVHNPTPEQEEARARLMRGPHVAPLLDKPAPAAPSEEPITLPDGSLYVPLENEDPRRPGLFFDRMGSRDKLRQNQYDADPQFRARCLAVRQKFAGNTPASQS